jgi:eukaryotic-like serine/threonine-protein kinase
MLVLELLGTPCLRDDTRSVPLAAQQKRRLGLLAILGLGGKQGLSRDRIEAYLWPESSGAHARHALDQAVYAIRQALGSDSILSTGRELRLNPGFVRADVWEFEEAIRAGQWATAVGHYNGPLLDGFHFADSRELESWIDTERARLLVEYQTAIERLAKLSAEAGDHSQSVTWWRRLVNSDPLSAGATRKLMLALAAVGDRAGAVKHARSYQELVRHELGIEPDSEVEGLAATLSHPAITETPVSHALEKMREDLFESADDFAEALNSPSIMQPATPRAVRGKDDIRRVRWMRYAATPLVILASGTAIWGWMRLAPSKHVLVFDSTEAIVPGTPLSGRLAISPDGSRLAYIGGPGAQLLIRPFYQLRATAIPWTEGAMTPFFSPDGTHVGFLREQNVQIASINGGPPITVSHSLTGVAGASWGPDNFIYADGSGFVSLVRVEAKSGAVPKWFTVLDTARGETDHTWPDVLPNGKGVLFTDTFNEKTGVKGRRSFAIAIADIPSGKHRVLLNDAMYARYAAPGHLLYVTTNRTLMAVPFDQDSMKVTGEPMALIEGMRLGFFGSADLAVSEAGTLVYATAAGESQQELVWVSRDGRRTQSVDPKWQGSDLWAPAFSPDGKRLAVARRLAGLKTEIWIKQLDRGTSIQLTSEGGGNFYPTWTPDGHYVTFSSNTLGSLELWTKRADGTARAVLQFHEKRGASAARWSPDGKWLVFETDTEEPGAGDILGIRPGIDTVPVPLVATKFTELSPAVSPDGKWLAYTSNETGQYEIYVVPFPNTRAAKWPVSQRGGTEPLWSHSGKELFYRDGAGYLVAVEVKPNPTFSLGHQTALFPAAGFKSLLWAPWYAVAPDDRRFLMVRPVAASNADKLIVIDNWFEELKLRK